jgi:hypothetical protein
MDSRLRGNDDEMGFVGWVERVRPPGMAGVQIMQEQLSVKPNARCTIPWIPACAGMTE